jgi:palmitoyltransferase ZDHHC9/14/18
MASDPPPPVPPIPPDGEDHIDHNNRASRTRYHAQTMSMTDFGSDGAESLAGVPGSVAGGHRDSRRGSSGHPLGVTGPAGEAGLPPSRPSTAATGASRGNWSQATPSRARGAPSVGSVANSRPPTSGSRTHVPSLTSHAFFKPMSSQRLQAQRGQRSSALGRSLQGGTQDTPKQQQQLRQQQEEPSSGDEQKLPVSRDTDVTEHTDAWTRADTNPSPDVAETVRSQGESIAPLRKPMELQHLDVEQANKNGTGSNQLTPITPTKSPRSFRSSFALPGRRGSRIASSQHQHPEGHEKLSSVASSPHYAPQEVQKAVVRKELGKNFEYFDGNTVFCWGGRLQNTRDRPINIATGLAVVLPGALFFGFS